jgi:tetratricopeptide (TPR) repeat protein
MRMPVLGGLVQCCYDLEDYEKCAEVFPRLQALKPLDEGELIQWGFALQSVGDPAGALVQYRRASEQAEIGTPARYAALRYMCHMQQELGDSEGARRTIGEILDHRPEDIPERFALAELLRDLACWQEAIDEFEQLAEDSPTQEDKAAALECLADLLYRRGRFSECVGVWSRLAALKELNRIDYWRWGYLLRDMGDPAAALDRFRHAAQLAPKESSVGIELLHEIYPLELETGAFEQAARTIDTLLQRDPQTAISAVLRGIDALECAGRYEEAAALLERILPECSDGLEQSWVLDALAGMCRYLGRTQDTERYLVRITEITECSDECRGEAAFSLGEDAFFQGRLDDAVRWLSVFCDRSPRHPIAQFHLAQALDALGEAERAGKHWEQAASLLRPGTPWHKEAVSRLQRDTNDTPNQSGAS